MRGRRRTFLIAGAILFASTALSTAAETIRPPLTARDSGAIRADAGLTGQSGWMLIDLDTGEVLDQKGGTTPFVPASVAKLPTAAFALDAMGPDHRFETTIIGTGGVTGGQLTGDLILVGGGDPELDTDALPALVNELTQRGVRSVRGGFYVDGTALPQLREIEPTQNVDASYNPSVSGLNLNFNRVHLKWDARGGKRQLSVEAESRRLSPQVDGVRVAVASQPGQPVFSLREQDDREIWQMSKEAFRGRSARWLPVKRPEAYAGEVFRTLASDGGIQLAPARLVNTTGQGEVLARHRSRPLGDVLRDMLRFSTNLTAEVSGTAATRSVGLKITTLAESAAVMNAWAASIGGFAPGDPGFKFANHSGLSLDGRVSPQRMVQFLAGLAKRAASPGKGHYRLPGGIAAYLKGHNVKDDAVPLDYDRLEVVAKTGTMSYVRGLAGYIATPGGRRLAFAVFSNDLARRSSRGERVNKGWMRRARAFERALIRNWVIKVDKST
ncbi:MAG: D-alanyl-D-alanine carboxypeptidase/D-alanyl-D-alanine-endopeptidase [Pseudomonadota bacterium]